MRIYADAYQLMSETGRNLWEMGQMVRPHTYQNKVIKGNDDFCTKELIMEQYCLTSLDSEIALFVFDRRNQEWAKHELLERINAKSYPINPGMAYMKRFEVWDEFLNDRKQFDYTYNERIWSKQGDYHALSRIIGELKANPDTRQAVLPIFHPSDIQYIGGARRVPCSVYYNFLLRKNPQGETQLNISYHQRSSDFVTHFGNDVWLAWKLMEYVAKNLEVKPGYLFHTIDSLHSYQKDWDKLKTPIATLLQDYQGTR